MAAPLGTALSVESDRIEEIINQSVGMFLPMFDPVWENTVVSNQGVGSADEIGRDWLIRKTYMGGLTGVIDGGAAYDDFALYGDTSGTPADGFPAEKLWMSQISNTWPDALLGPNQRPYKLGIPMRSMLTNIAITLGEANADANSGLIGEVIAPKMTAFGKNISQTLCNFFYLSQNDFYNMATVTDESTDITYRQIGGSGNYVVAIWDLTNSNYAVHRFYPGMRIQFYDSTGATLKVTDNSGASVFIVTSVDEMTGTVEFMAEDGDALGSSHGGATDRGRVGGDGRSQAPGEITVARGEAQEGEHRLLEGLGVDLLGDGPAPACTLELAGVGGVRPLDGEGAAVAGDGRRRSPEPEGEDLAPALLLDGPGRPGGLDSSSEAGVPGRQQGPVGRHLQHLAADGADRAGFGTGDDLEAPFEHGAVISGPGARAKRPGPGHCSLRYTAPRVGIPGPLQVQQGLDRNLRSAGDLDRCWRHRGPQREPASHRPAICRRPRQ